MRRPTSFLAFSPEREDPGNPHFQAATIPKVVGGYDEKSGELACALYGHAVVKVVPVSSWKSPRRARSWRTPTAR